METPYSDSQMSEIPAAVSRKIASSPGKESVFVSDRQVLVDMTNDCPINGIETPASKTKSNPHDEKSVTQSVESNCIKPGFSLRTPLYHLDGYQASPSRLLAPTPANTPESAITTHVASNGSLPRKLDHTIGRSKDLCISPLGPEFKDDSMSITPLEDKGRGAPHLSPTSVDDAQEESKVEDQAKDQANNYHETEKFEDENEYDEEGETIEDDECDELCKGLNKVSVHEGIPPFAGRHTRFVYNSDDEIEGEEVASAVPSPSVVHLKGMPTPTGKHIRFEEDDESEKASN